MSPSFPSLPQPLAAIATTPNALHQLYPVCQTLNATLYVPASVTLPPYLNLAVNSTVNLQQIIVIPDQQSLKQQIQELWPTHQGLIFCLAIGAVIRLIAPLLQHKSTDPAIVVMDEAGKFAISLCSGHQGGADQLTHGVARCLGATPVITGASAALGLSGVDRLGTPFGWERGPGDWTAVSAAVARGETVQVIQSVGSILWRSALPSQHSFEFKDRFEDQSEDRSEDLEDKFPAFNQARAQIWISPQPPKPSVRPQVSWYPRVLWLGIGCERNTPESSIRLAIQRTLQQFDLAPEAIAGIATLDLKADEPGLVQLCQQQHWPLLTFGAECLRSVSVPHPSLRVEQEVGTPSVAEAAALTAAHTQVLRVPKQIHRFEDSRIQVQSLGQAENRMGQAVTVAVAQAEQEYIGRIGQLWLVGIGPGHLDQITPAARLAITTADVVIGYSLYLDLIAPLQRPGQIIESFPITQERQRAERAITLANWGLTVAVVSSGDCGIYGMAGLVLETLKAQGWDGVTPQVQGFPGISAIQAAAARVGAPLMHDFCAISLSDLLTPWPLIEQRLQAAAMADLICGIYNPRSRNRHDHLLRAQTIFLAHRSPQTPVAIVRAAYRPEEQIMLTTLEKLDQEPVDMLSIVLIGNQSTIFYQNRMITPRGYNGFSR
ncbi:MAG: precorrin-3B C(17)-methyltransferase [Oscillatoriales cyanobacterium RM2_1_1]|nr:precorrin-3B C(17)-methyltransferase [Oscillatoriales cyanobacterium RM2_1_1]